MKEIIENKNKAIKVNNQDNIYLKYVIPCLSNNIFNFDSFSSIILIFIL